MGIELGLFGLDGLNDMLERLSGDELVRAARDGLEDGLQDIRTEAWENCPRVTGKLRESIRTRVRMDKGDMRGEVYAGEKYAVYVEMGTGPRGERFSMPAKPFLYPAYKANEGRVKEKIARAVIRAVKKGDGEA